MALHEHAQKVKQACADGTVTYEKLNEYHNIVSRAIQALDEAVALAKPSLDAMAATTFTPPGGKPEGAGKPAGAGRQ